jgi:hypothetical protein
MPEKDHPSINLSLVTAPPSDEGTESEQLAEKEFEALEIARRKTIVAGLQDDLLARRTWGNRIFLLLVAWLIAVFVVVVCQGFGLLGFHLSDSVLITLITTTTANILGLGYVVANYLFPKNKA